MTQHFTTHRLGELGTFRNGVNFTKDQKGGDGDDSFAIINVKDIFTSGRHINFAALDRVSLPDIRNRERYTVKRGDLYFVRSSVKRDGIGLVSLSTRDDDLALHCGFVIRFRVESIEVDRLFLVYQLRSGQYREMLKNLSGGSAITNISQDSLALLEVSLPPLPTQRKIAGVLSAYDDLIENNTRRIAILEEMAQAIYREWFVNFRFPGHEKVKLINSPLGKIPEGWEVVKVEDAIFVNPKVTVPKDGEKSFVSMGAVPHNTMLIDVAAVEMRTGNSGSKFQNGDTLFARITPCLENGKTAFVQFLESSPAVAFGSTEFIVLRSKTVCPEFVYLLARSDPFRDNAIKSMSGATGRQRVQEKCFDTFFFAHPDSKTLAEFAATMQSLFRQVFTLANKNRNLRTTRDLLLPKLISGQLDVEELDIETGEPLVEAEA
ncbi:MAG: restriction endonuclease subunit S [Pirellulaceae bacterium]|nr:restriction endonuclease subunit S [Pirellulaceae bacterium]